MLKGDVQKWSHGKCEAGLPGIAERLPACEHRARWMVSGVILCGTCKRKLVGGAK